MPRKRFHLMKEVRALKEFGHDSSQLLPVGIGTGLDAKLEVDSLASRCRVRIVMGAGGVELASSPIEMFEQIAAEENWQPGGELLAHVRRSVYFCLEARDASSELELVGALQLALASSVGTIPSQRVWHDVDFTARHRRIAHVTVLALRKEWRGRQDAFMLFWLLAVEMWRYCVEQGIEELWLEATPRILKLYQRLGFPLTVRGDLREHWGEPCFLASMTIREVAGALAEKAVRSKAYREIFSSALRLGTPENETVLTIC
ncbi:MAG: hypothetical protein EOP06_05175 [Proteobacteria bacterium]|nr:MAG: hypothetical protein EOP06_05175 [Pseudomonadota bacterium]